MTENNGFLELIAMPSDGTESLFDNLPMQPGIHLRWAFEPLLGFPPHGFTIYKIYRDEFYKNPSRRLPPLAKLTLPIYNRSYYPANGRPFADETAEAERRLKDQLSGEFLAHYREQLTELIELLHRLMRFHEIPKHQRLIHELPRPRSENVNFPIQDLLLLSSFDPHFARLLGLYYIDSDIMPGELPEYQVEGDWGTMAWPYQRVDFYGLNRDSLSSRDFEVNGVHIFSAREVKVEHPESDNPSLSFAGAGNLSLHITFPFPVQEVVLHIPVDSGTPDWQVEVTPTGLSSIELFPAKGTLRIQSNGDQKFDRIDLTDSSRAYRTWVLDRMEYRTHREPVGKISSEFVQVQPLTPVNSPKILFLQPHPLPPLINESGKIPDFSSQVELESHVPNSERDSFRPVKLHTKRTQAVGLAAYWPLQDSVDNLIVASSIALMGNATLKPISDSNLMFPGEAALELDGANSGLKILYPSALNTLGSTFTMEAWIYLTGYGSDGFPTIIGNDYEVSYWLGIAGTTNQLRFYLNGAQHKDSQHKITPNRWHHVATTYDGNHLRFYIDGRADEPIHYAQGAMRANSGQPLGIGIDPGTKGDDRLLYGFQGQIAHVAIWKRVLSPEELATHQIPLRPQYSTRPGPVIHQLPELLAGFPFNGNTVDFKTGIPAHWIGPEAYNNTDAASRIRLAIELNGDNFLELHDRTEFDSLSMVFILQAWVYPYAQEFSYRTIIGNNWQESFWLGLSSNYRLRLWLNRQQFETTRALPANQWTHVIASYDGETVRFYLDGHLESSHPARLGNVSVNSRKKWCIGAESGATATNHWYTFKGMLADVYIWGRRCIKPDAIDPALIACWLFNQSLRDRKTGLWANTHGEVQFVTGHPENAQRQVLFLPGTGFVETRDHPQLDSISTKLTLQAWIYPQAGHAYPTIIGNNFENSFYFGLAVNLATGPCRLRFVVKDRSVISVGHIPLDYWSHVAVVYDGMQVRFYINGKLDSTFNLALGPLPKNTVGVLCIGADAGSTAGYLSHPFKGKLADVQIWNDVPQAPKPVLYKDRALLGSWPMNGNALDLITNQYGVMRDERATFESNHPENGNLKVLSLSGDERAGVEIPDRTDLLALEKDFSLQAWIFPTGDAGSRVIIGNKKPETFWLELEYHVNWHTLRLFLNSQTFESTTRIQAHRWSRILVSYDGEHVRFHINGAMQVQPHPADLGPVGWAPPQKTIYIGQQTARSSDRLRTQAGLKLADVRIWRRAVDPEKAERLKNRIEPPAQFIDRWMPDGAYEYQVQGIDMFGRVSDWSEPGTIEVIDRNPPPSPVNVRARFLPIRGHITAVEELPAEEDGATPELKLSTDIDASFSFRALRRYDVQVAHAEATSVVRQNFDILHSEKGTGRKLKLTIKQPPFAQLRPQAGDSVTIHYDYFMETEWAWTGWQRIHAPRTREFRLYRQPGPLNTIAGNLLAAERSGGHLQLATDITYEGQVNTLVNLWCQIDQHQYKITGNTTGSNIQLEVEFLARPVISPNPGDNIQIVLPPDHAWYMDFDTSINWQDRLQVVPLRSVSPIEMESAMAKRVESAEIEDLRNEEVSWMPEENTGVYRLIFNDIDLPEELHNVGPTDYVPGAVVAYNLTNDPPGWQIYNVIWYKWQTSRTLTLFLQLTYEEAQAGIELEMRSLTFYPGQKYKIRVNSPPPPDMIATFEWAVGVAAADGQTQSPDPKGEADRFGNESAVAGPVVVIAVDRQRPPVPPRPEVSMEEPADYYGKAKANVTWPRLSGADSGLTYHLYRAVDTAIFTRDLEQRRGRSGYYREKTPHQILGDDPDFLDWLRARFPDLTDDWQRKLFVPKPAADAGPDSHDSRAWEEATPIWRAWIERFYPALYNEELAVIAERVGNETAFTLATGEALHERRYIDLVDGLVRNQYFYRLQTMSVALLPSSELGPVSEPQAPPKIKPPRAPVFSNIEAGDRMITLHWALNREPDLKEYRLYRAETREDLEDLRWFGEGDDPRLIRPSIPDPRLKVKNYYRLEWSGESAIAEILGVYRADEFDRHRDPITDQPGAMNYFISSSQFRSSETDYIIEGLRRIAGGTTVIVVYRDVEGVVQVLDRFGRAPPYEDRELVGLRDYYYRLVAIDAEGNVSEGSRIIQARAYDQTPPEPPALALALNAARPSVTLFWDPQPFVRYMVQRRSRNNKIWLRISSWLSGGTNNYEDSGVRRGETYVYRLRAQSSAGNLNTRYVEEEIIIPEEE